LQLGRGVAHW